jgi:hypothetical protein
VVWDRIPSILLVAFRKWRAWSKAWKPTTSAQVIDCTGSGGGGGERGSGGGGKRGSSGGSERGSDDSDSGGGGIVRGVGVGVVVLAMVELVCAAVQEVV